MRKQGLSLRMLVTAGLCLGMSLASLAPAKERPAGAAKNRQQSLSKITGEPRAQILNINNITTWMRNDGESNHSPSASDGCYFPRGTSHFIYQDGLMWGGKCYVDAALTVPAPNAQLIRVGGNNYDPGVREGWIIGQGAAAVAVDPGEARARAFRIRRDYYFMSEAEVRRDAAESNELTDVNSATTAQMQTVRDRYDKDWKDWPVDLGAPYIERNGTPGYQLPPAFSATFNPDSLISQKQDEPGLAGADPNSAADQVIWLVYNDLDVNQTLGFHGSDPMGLEAQVTLWGYSRSDALGNIYFKRYKFANKGGVAIDAAGTKGSFYINEMYVAQWSDPDLGTFGDDILGCDSVASIGFVYNSNAIDDLYNAFTLPPPCAGYDFLQGPAVPSPGDSAVFDLKIVRDKKNIGMSSFSWFAANAAYSDPGGNYTNGTLRWYKLLRGFVPLDGDDALYPTPPGVAPTKYPLSGDPVKGVGFLDGQGTNYSFAPGDRRSVMSTGPFRLDPGETQEVVVALIGGLGADRLSSVAVMKFNDRFAQNTYNALFQVPKAPAPPAVIVNELNGEVVLEWGSNLVRVNETETKVNNPGAYKFEGYNVYQFTRRGGGLADAKRIVTYDQTTDPTVVLNEVFDLASGQVLSIPVQFGSNSGITRSFGFKRDYVKDIDKIYNGQDYFLGVTAYSVAQIPGFLPSALESEPRVIVVTPKRPFGTAFEQSGATITLGDTLSGVVHVGVSDGTASPIVINTAVLTGHQYKVVFKDDGTSTTVWDLIDVTANNKVVLANQVNQAGDNNYPITEGFQLRVAGPPPGVKEWTWTGTRFLTWGGADGLSFEGFNGALGWASARSVFGDGVHVIPADKLKKIEIRFANADANDLEFDPNQPNGSFAYRYGRGFTGAPAKPEFAPFMVVTTGAGYIYQDFTKSVPLAVYDVEANPPRRLALAFLENNQPGGKVDGRYNPGVNGVTDNVAGSGPREWLWIFDADYSETPNPEWQVGIIAPGPQPVMYFATFQRRNTNAWTDQDILTVVQNRPNTIADSFTFTTPAPTVTKDLQAASFNAINVFPNPYYALNPAEETYINRFVTFNNLPPTTKIRIFNMAGQLVRTLEKTDDPLQFMKWNLQNQIGLPVASGMYIAYIEGVLSTSGEKVSKVLKLAIFQEQEILEFF